MAEPIENALFDMDENPSKRAKLEEQGKDVSEDNPLQLAIEHQHDDDVGQGHQEYITEPQPNSLNNSPNKVNQLTATEAESSVVSVEQSIPSNYNEIDVIIKQFCDALTNEQERISFFIYYSTS